MLTLTDQLGREVSLINWPKRIISLVPSQTELLFYWGLDKEIAGITQYCIHPADKTAAKLKVGGTKKLNLPLIHALNPDLILANKEENDRLQMEELMAHYPTYVSNPHNLPSALQMISDIGKLVNRTGQSEELTATINTQFRQMVIAPVRRRVLYVIWRKPYMAAGKGTFIDDMLRRCGFVNIVSAERYPEISIDTVKQLAPEFVLLSSEPYPFNQKHAHEIALQLPGTPVKLVDGEMFSWYGSRLLHAPAYFENMLAGF
jgi:ABC-type Fe3+-hydroxamate transport system substrate-binding protein